ncbi:MAG: helix-turn-helix domain-containing protein [Actinomycetota bacterium]|nr:helix-turn-helix domain-containing protein [Actinomycetota bacterium]
MNADNDARTIGRRVRQIRYARGKSLRVIAGLAGISPSHLSRIERGLVALDRRSEIVALANALQVAPAELTTLPVPAPADGCADVAVVALRGAIQAVTMGIPNGSAQSVEQLSARVHAVLDAKQRCRHAEVGMVLPALIRDLHTSIDAGRDDAELLRLAVELHHAGTQAYLHGVGAPTDLCWSAALLARQAAERLDEPVSLGVAAFGQANGLLSWGSFELAMQALHRDEIGVGDDPELVGMLTLSESLLAAAQERAADVEAALEHAVDLAAHTGEGNAHYMSFGPTNVTLWRLSAALESGNHEHAVQLAELLTPDRIIAPTRRANYWVNYGRALSRVRGRRHDAARALRQAERISPDKVHRNPFARETLAELVMRSRQDAAGRELRGMAYRAGLPV